MDKSELRKSKIFAVLDEAKANGERITAQLLAAKVNMGKQTVLPFYRQWQELEAIGVSEHIELPCDFESALKRLIAKEMFEVKRQTLELKDDLDDEHIRHGETKALCEQKEIKISELEETNRQLGETVEAHKQKIQTLDTRIAKLVDKELTLNHQLNKLEKRCEQAERDKFDALEKQEKRLDQSHQQLLNHWMAVVDKERREKEKISRQLDEVIDKHKKAEHTLSEQVLTIKTLSQEKQQMQAQLQESTATLERNKRELNKLGILDSILALLSSGGLETVVDDVGALVKQDNLNKLKLANMTNLEQELKQAKSDLQHLEHLNKENTRLQIKVAELEYFLKGLKQNSSEDSDVRPLTQLESGS